MDPFVLAVLIVALGLIFDYTNGFHDCANVVSTVIATRVLKPFSAIVLAGVLNTIGATQIGAVAQTITSGLVHHLAVTQITILSALLGAIAWNVITWYHGIPSSSSYSLVGALIGSTWQSIGGDQILWSGILYKVVIPMLISPFIGYTIAWLFMKTLVRGSNSLAKLKNERLFGNLQIGSASIVALSHGLNDAQKSMGLITLGLFASKLIPSQTVPIWVVLACAVIMGAGTASGGVRIIRTVGFSITQLDKRQGFAAEISASVVILIASFLGMPISSTHMIIGSVTGVGAAKDVGGVNWGIWRKLSIGWVFTLPASAIIASIITKLITSLSI